MTWFANELEFQNCTNGAFQLHGKCLFRTDGHAIHVRHQGENTESKSSKI